MPYLIIHGHFYQPPRENPWTGIVERQPGAAPFHDWNERIHAECYQPNSAAVVADQSNGESRTVNNYTNISFNFGPTLLSWLEAHHPETYARIIAADRDLRTQIRWGLADFRFRFGREAESLWLPETACNERVLNTLIDEGLRYVILAPHQAKRVRTQRDNDKPDQDRTANDSERDKEATKEWSAVDERTLNTSAAYLYRQ